MPHEEPQKALANQLTPNPQQEKLTYASLVAIQNSSFVALQPQGVKPPFYACGHHPMLVNLAQAVGVDQPFYKIDAYALLEQRLATGQPIDLHIEEMADHFVPQILASQANGPYYLGGGCEGALIAFEIAQQLESLQHKIAMLVIWDTPISSYWRNENGAYASIRRLSRLFSSGRPQLKRRLSRLLKKTTNTFTHATADQSRRIQVEKILFNIARKYLAKSYQRDIILFRASESDFKCLDATWGWGSAC
jgi:thioesterase domain-containing protein